MSNKLLIGVLALTVLTLSSYSVIAMASTFEQIDNNIQMHDGDISWPSEEIIQKKAVSRNKIPSSDFDYLKIWLSTVLKKEWIPSDLTDRFVLLENLYSENDYFVGRYKKDNNIIQIKAGGGYLWLTIKPNKGPSFYKGNEEFVLAVAKAFINYDKDQLAKLRVSTGQDKDIGGIKIEQAKTKDNVQYRYWYEDIVWRIVDEQYICFTISPPKEVKIGGKPRWIKTDWKGGMVISK